MGLNGAARVRMDGRCPDECKLNNFYDLIIEAFCAKPSLFKVALCLSWPKICTLIREIYICV